MLNLLKNQRVLYLTVSALLIIQSAILYFGNVNWNNYFITTSYTILFSSTLLLTIWFFIKSILENKIKIEEEVNALKNFKRNFNFFQFHSKNIEEYDDFENLKGITFGNENASTQLSLLVNPNCENSRKSFKEAYELFQNNPEKIHVHLLFNINPNPKEITHKSIAENLLALTEQNPEKAKEAVIDWFINQMSVKNWSVKWNVETPHLLINKQLQSQYYWCLKNEFTHTPVKIINGNLFPDEYEISELAYFINDFQEEFKYEESLKVV